MKLKLLGQCNVDSGTILMTDPCYLHTFEPMPPSDEAPKAPKARRGNYGYDGVLGMGSSSGDQLYKGKNRNAGVVMSTGVGDGVFPVYAMTSDDGYLLGCMISFDGDLDEDDFGPDDDEDGDDEEDEDEPD